MTEPFKFGCIVENEHFCPRPELQRELTRHIRGGQNLVLQGERRRGKSSLVVKAVRDIRGMGLLYVDLLGIETRSDFCRRVVEGVVELDRSRSFIRKTVSLLTQLRPLVTIDANTGAPSVSVDVRSAAGPSGVGAVMSMISAHARERKLCVVFDEFQDILNLSDSAQVLSEMRGRIQFLPGTSFVFLGSVRNQMSEIFSHPRNPFFKSALEVNVSEIDRGIFTRFLAERFRKANRKVAESFLGELFDSVEGVPGDLQELCDALWSVTETGEGVSRGNLEAAYRYIFAHEGSSYELYLRQMTLQQRKVLRALAVGGGAHTLSNEFRDLAGIHNASSVKKALLRIVELGHAYYYRDAYRFANPFFKEWVTRR